MLSDCAGRFLSYFPRLSSTSSRKNFNNGTLFPWIPCKIISKKSPQLHLLTKQKKATIAFWNRLGHDKLTRTGRLINASHICTILLERIWHWYVYMFFSQLSTSALLTKLDLATNSWWQRWQLCCLFRQQAKLFPSHVWSKFAWFPFEMRCSLQPVFFGWYPLHTYPCPSVFQDVVTYWKSCPLTL